MTDNLDLDTLHWLHDKLTDFEDTNKVYEFPPAENDVTEPGDWVIDADFTFEDEENNRVETWTFKLFWWAGPAAIEKDKKYEQCWQMRRRATKFFDTRGNWGMGGNVNTSKMNPSPEGAKSVGPYFHGEAIWIALCFEVEAIRIVQHGK